MRGAARRLTPFFYLPTRAPSWARAPDPPAPRPNKHPNNCPARSFPRTEERAEGATRFFLSTTISLPTGRFEPRLFSAPAGPPRPRRKRPRSVSRAILLSRADARHPPAHAANSCHRRVEARALSTASSRPRYPRAGDSLSCLPKGAARRGAAASGGPIGFGLRRALGPAHIISRSPGAPLDTRESC